MTKARKSAELLKRKLFIAKKKVKLGQHYAHFKHPGEKRYQLMDIGIFEKTEEVCVIYKSLETGELWIRTLDNFLEKVEFGGKKVKRFEVV